MVTVRLWLDRTDAAIASAITRLKRAEARFRKDAQEFARDRQIYEKSRNLVDRISLPDSDATGRGGS